MALPKMANAQSDHGLVGGNKKRKRTEEEVQVPSHPRIMTALDLTLLRRRLRAILDGVGGKKLDIKSYTLPESLNRSIYEDKAYTYHTLEDVREAANAAASNALWTERPRPVDEEPEHEDKDEKHTLHSLATAEYFITKHMKHESALKFIPARLVDPNCASLKDIDDEARKALNSVESQCRHMKIKFNDRMLAWVIATVMDPAFDDCVGYDFLDVRMWFLDRLKVPADEEEGPLSGKKFAIWLLTPFASGLNLPFIFCHPHNGLDDVAKVAKYEARDYAYVFCAHMAAKCFVLAVDHGEGEIFKQYWESYLEEFVKSNKGLSDYLFKDVDKLPVREMKTSSRL